MKYEHIKCECGGIIGMYNRKNFSCEQCGKRFESYKIQYDVIHANNKTGWIFPMKIKENSHD